MTENDDVLTLIDADDVPAPAAPVRTWKVAIIDDDRAVHDGTRFALADFVLNGHGLELLSAYSAAEGRDLLRAHPDTAIVLLDVVMETDAAGLDLISFIRNELKNEVVRIILRTGQPGQAPERQVIVDYDINDYKAKTELTADRLFTTMTAALRGFEQLQRTVETRRGLEIIVEAASTLFDFKSMQRLAEGVLTQLSSLLRVDCAGILVLRDRGLGHAHFSVLAGSGCYRELTGLNTPKGLAPALCDLIESAFERRRTEFFPERSIFYITTAGGSEVVVLLEAAKRLAPTDKALVEIFCSRLSIAFDNVVLYDELQRANASLERRVAERTAELTAANQRLEAQWTRARRANALKSEVLGTVAHDLKSPLGVILGRAEMLDDLLRDGVVSPDPVRRQLGHIRDLARALTRMVDALIADAMADALDITIRRERLDLSRLIEDVVEANRPLAERKQQTIAVGRLQPAFVECDYDRIREAVDNVIGNAVKYSRIGGRIDVETELAGNRVIVRVRDSGPGLLPEDLSRLFGRFQRLSAKPTGGESSTGLGLSIAKRIVDLHGGTIQAEALADDQGAIFSLALPVGGGGASA